MPTITDIIDSIASPPLASLQQVLDTNGPYGPGSHTLSTFHTDGAFLLPPGTYGVSGTYGVIVQATGAFPPAAGFLEGWNDVFVASGNEYFDRICQICLLHVLPITGATVITEVHDVNILQALFLWPALIGSAASLGLHVSPSWSVDLFYMCVL